MSRGDIVEALRQRVAFELGTRPSGPLGAGWGCPSASTEPTGASAGVGPGHAMSNGQGWMQTPHDTDLAYSGSWGSTPVGGVTHQHAYGAPPAHVGIGSGGQQAWGMEAHGGEYR